MINRRTLRVKVLQLLYSYSHQYTQSDDIDKLQLKISQELDISISGIEKNFYDLLSILIIFKKINEEKREIAKSEKIIPENKYLTASQNPPDVKIIFFKNLINIKNMSCYSNEEDKWEKSNINFVNDNEINIKLRGKFTTERGRINCSLMDKNGTWRWFGIQYVLEEN